MSALFIIGNGFDLAHGLPTHYNDFRSYLIHKLQKEEVLSPSFNISSYTRPDGSEEYAEEDVISFLVDVISKAEEDGDNWSDIENSLGNLDLEEYLSEMSSLLDEDTDRDMWRRVYRNEDASNHFYNVTIKIKDLFSEWVNTIQISDTQSRKKLVELIDVSNDEFLTFNYTTLLEELYEANNVFYIHGMQFSEIIIGHGEYRENFDNRFLGSEYSLYRIHSALRKDTQKIISDSQSFYKSLSSVNKIYSYGFSFSKVDLPYISEIMSKLDTKDITWYLSDYESDDVRENYKSRIEACGFEGEFISFSI